MKVTLCLFLQPCLWEKSYKLLPCYKKGRHALKKMNPQVGMTFLGEDKSIPKLNIYSNDKKNGICTKYRNVGIRYKTHLVLQVLHI